MLFSRLLTTTKIKVFFNVSSFPVPFWDLQMVRHSVLLGKGGEVEDPFSYHFYWSDYRGTLRTHTADPKEGEEYNPVVWTTFYVFSGTHSCFIPFSPWQKVKQLDDYILDVQISPKWTFFLLLLKNTSLSPNKSALESSLAFGLIFWLLENLNFPRLYPRK